MFCFWDVLEDPSFIAFFPKCKVFLKLLPKMLAIFIFFSASVFGLPYRFLILFSCRLFSWYICCQNWFHGFCGHVLFCYFLKSQIAVIFHCFSQFFRIHASSRSCRWLALLLFVMFFLLSRNHLTHTETYVKLIVLSP